MPKQHQPPLDIDRQIENLKSIGLQIDDERSAHDFLNNVSYFRLIKAFGLGLKNDDSTFKNDVTFEQIKGLYIFNSKFRYLLFPQIEKVEVNLRCRVANYFSCKYGVLGYKDVRNFRNPEFHAKCLLEINAEIERSRKSAFVKNFRENYEGGELPFYALVELLSFGTLSKFYKNMKNEDKQEIANLYGVKYTYLESWIEHLTIVRNICAHYGRLYNINLTSRPQLYKQYTERGIGNYRVFATLICLKHLLPNDSHWKKFIVSVGALIEQFPCVNIKLMGFPEHKWLEILSLPLDEFYKLDY
ncbi:MAG: Abi family protein [Roseburia sp.]|nr:Abi family protein [Roseburia sp.]